jgi:ABC-type polysaccharide/polyol phosphate transport system ATPase subunit
MSEYAIEISGLKKEFLIHHSGGASLKTLVLPRYRRGLEHLQVLRGIDLKVPSGQCCAVIGRNGAGKSTLLSLLARVYLPTEGEITIRGRIAPLLELGAGFHPDLTGIDNIFFNGIVLGLTRKQVSEKLEAIVAFSELESQIDVPVRTYSSGMLARLGFSVAIHADADILLVDEVLAVGDLDFEQKCYRSIEKFQAGGGTIFFVSHDLDAVKRVADRVLWLSEGTIIDDGIPEVILPQYEASFSAD